MVRISIEEPLSSNSVAIDNSCPGNANSHEMTRKEVEPCSDVSDLPQRGQSLAIKSSDNGVSTSSVLTNVATENICPSIIESKTAKVVDVHHAKKVKISGKKSKEKKHKKHSDVQKYKSHKSHKSHKKDQTCKTESTSSSSTLIIIDDSTSRSSPSTTSADHSVTSALKLDVNNENAVASFKNNNSKPCGSPMGDNQADIQIIADICSQHNVNSADKTDLKRLSIQESLADNATPKIQPITIKLNSNSSCVVNKQENGLRGK